MQLGAPMRFAADHDRGDPSDQTATRDGDAAHRSIRFGGMEERRLGSSDVTVSTLGLGCNNVGGWLARLDVGATRALVDAALDVGVTFLDTADVYGDEGSSERILGEVLKGRRDRVVLATKFGFEAGDLYGDSPGPGGSAAYVRRAAEASLARLQTDWIDVYYYHWPDGVTPIAETLAAMGELVDAGKVRAIGCSNFSAEQLREAEDVATSTGTHRFVGLQNEYSLLRREAEDELLPLCAESCIGFVPYFPLASGLLTGKYGGNCEARPGARLAEGKEVGGMSVSESSLRSVSTLEAFARDHGRSLLELALSSLASRPGVASVLAGASSAAQVRDNAAAATWRLTDRELADLSRLTATF